jgi:hypothetical protein
MNVMAHPQPSGAPERQPVRQGSSVGILESVGIAMGADSPFVRLCRAVAVTGGGVVAGLSFDSWGGVLGGLIGGALFVLSEKAHK